MSDILDVLGFLYVLTTYLILLPFVIYSVHKYERQSRRHQPVLAFRNKTLIYTINCVVLIKLLIERPLQLVYRVWFILDISTLYFVQILSEIVTDAILILFTIKVYHLYFKHRYNLSIAEKAWRTNINPTDTNWYILHKKTFGNPVWLMKCCIPLFTLFTIVDFIVIITAGERTLAYRLINTSLETLLLIIALMCYWKIRTFHDAYHIRKEVVFQFLSLAMHFILTIVIHSIFCDVPQIDINAQADVDHGAHLKHARLYWLVIVYATAITLAPLALSSLLYPLYLVDQYRSMNEIKNNLSYDCDSTHNNRVHKSGPGFRKLLLVISTERYFKLFMQYLVQSLCCENLLFIVELIQIKVSYQEKHNNVVHVAKQGLCEIACTDNEKVVDSGYAEYDFNTASNAKHNDKYAIIVYRDCAGKLIYHRTSLTDYHVVSYFKNKVFTSKKKEFLNLHVSVPPNLPQTIILDANESLADQMNELYLKYIEVDSYHEVNISYERRQLLEDFFQFKLPKLSNDKHVEWQLYSVLDEVCVAVLHLMFGQFQLFLCRNPNINEEINALIDSKDMNPEPLLTILQRVRVDAL